MYAPLFIETKVVSTSMEQSVVAAATLYCRLVYYTRASRLVQVEWCEKLASTSTPKLRRLTLPASLISTERAQVPVRPEIPTRERPEAIRNQNRGRWLWCG
jgi:hypothetical protein